MTDPTRPNDRTDGSGTATRRRLLALAGGAAVAGVAGCLSSPTGGGSTGDGGTTHEGGDDHHGGETTHQGDEHHDGAETTHGGDDHHGGETTHQGDEHHDGATTRGDDDHHGGETTHQGDEHHDGETTHEGGETTESDAADHSHHDDHHHETLPEGPQAEVEVKMITTEEGGYHFEPHVAWVEEGGTVTFVNESGSHSATAYHPDNDGPRRIPEGGTAFDTGTLTGSGASETYTLDTAGVYDYFCIPHERLGMLATVVVGEPDPHGQPGLSDPGEDLPSPVREKIAELNDLANTALGHEH